jgi:phosphoserine phosphatase
MMKQDTSEKLIAFDLDNVLIDTTQHLELAKRIDKEENVRRVKTLISQVRNGNLTLRTGLVEITKLLKGLSLHEIEEVADNLPLMPGVVETCERLKSEHFKLAIISNGYSIVADCLKEKLRFDYSVANYLVFGLDKTTTGEIDGELLDERSKSRVLKRLLHDSGLSTRDCVAVGDGANDYYMLKTAGLSIAFNFSPKLKRLLQGEKKVKFVARKDLRAILNYVIT